MPRYHANVTLHLDEFYAPDHGAAQAFIDAFISRMADASERSITEVTWNDVDYNITHATAPELAEP